jgi:uncharacterized protein
MTRRIKRRIVIAAMVLTMAAAVAYAALVGALYLKQEQLIFPGRALPSDFRFQFDQRFQEVRIPVPGALLDALHFTQDQPRGLVFFLHGNAGKLPTWTTGIDFYRRVNYDLFILDYRGYGKSTGRIESEQQLDADVRAAWDIIAPRYRGKPIVIYGRSLGTGLAAKLATDVNASLLVLVSPYSSLAAAAKEAYPLAPEWLLKYPLRTDQVIASVKMPIVLLHGSEDRRMPLAHSRRLAALASTRVELIVVEGAGHDHIQRFPS